MTEWMLTTAGLVALVGALIHGLVGGRIYMQKINLGNLPALTKSLSLVAWHMFTIFLLVCAITLFYVASNPVFEAAAYPLIAANFIGSILFIGLGLTGHGHLLRMPGAYLMGATAILGWLGLS